MLRTALLALFIISSAISSLMCTREGTFTSEEKSTFLRLEGIITSGPVAISDMLVFAHKGGGVQVLDPITGVDRWNFSIPKVKSLKLTTSSTGDIVAYARKGALFSFNPVDKKVSGFCYLVNKAGDAAMVFEHGDAGVYINDSFLYIIRQDMILAVDPTTMFTYKEYETLMAKKETAVTDKDFLDKQCKVIKRFSGSFDIFNPPSFVQTNLYVNGRHYSKLYSFNKELDLIKAGGLSPIMIKQLKARPLLTGKEHPSKAKYELTVKVLNNTVEYDNPGSDHFELLLQVDGAPHPKLNKVSLPVSKLGFSDTITLEKRPGACELLVFHGEKVLKTVPCTVL